MKDKIVLTILGIAFLCMMVFVMGYVAWENRGMNEDIPEEYLEEGPEDWDTTDYTTVDYLDANIANPRKLRAGPDEMTVFMKEEELNRPYFEENFIYTKNEDGSYTVKRK